MINKASILIILLFVSVGVFGYLIFRQDSAVEIGSNQGEIEDYDKQIEVEDTGAIDMKVYTNEEYRFKIKYPENREIKILDNDIVVIHNPKQTSPHGSISIKIRDNNNKLTLREYYKNLSETSDILVPDYFEISKYKYIPISHFTDAVQFDSVPMPPAPIVAVRTAIPVDNVIIEIDLLKRVIMENAEAIEDGDDQEYAEAMSIYNNILDTIKFFGCHSTKENDEVVGTAKQAGGLDTSGLNIYDSEEHGFLFKYPKNLELRGTSLISANFTEDACGGVLNGFIVYFKSYDKFPNDYTWKEIAGGPGEGIGRNYYYKDIKINNDNIALEFFNEGNGFLDEYDKKNSIIRISIPNQDKDKMIEISMRTVSDEYQDNEKIFREIAESFEWR